MPFNTLSLFVKQNSLLTLLSAFTPGNAGVGLVTSGPEISSVHFPLSIFRTIVDFAIIMVFIVLKVETPSWIRKVGVRRSIYGYIWIRQYGSVPYMWASMKFLPRSVFPCFQKSDKNAKTVEKKLKLP